MTLCGSHGISFLARKEFRYVVLLWALPTLYSFMVVRYNWELPHLVSNCESRRESQGSLSFQVSESEFHKMQKLS